MKFSLLAATALSTAALATPISVSEPEALSERATTYLCGQGSTFKAGQMIKPAAGSTITLPSSASSTTFEVIYCPPSTWTYYAGYMPAGSSPLMTLGMEAGTAANAAVGGIVLSKDVKPSTDPTLTEGGSYYAYRFNVTLNQFKGHYLYNGGYTFSVAETYPAIGDGLRYKSSTSNSVTFKMT